MYFYTYINPDIHFINIIRTIDIILSDIVQMLGRKLSFDQPLLVYIYFLYIPTTYSVCVPCHNIILFVQLYMFILVSSSSFLFSFTFLAYIFLRFFFLCFFSFLATLFVFFFFLHLLFYINAFVYFLSVLFSFLTALFFFLLVLQGCLPFFTSHLS